jgi:hypothetical protein
VRCTHWCTNSSSSPQVLGSRLEAVAVGHAPVVGGCDWGCRALATSSRLGLAEGSGSAMHTLVHESTDVDSSQWVVR